jgi:hypothetical protein
VSFANLPSAILLDPGLSSTIPDSQNLDSQNQESEDQESSHPLKSSR